MTQVSLSSSSSSSSTEINNTDLSIYLSVSLSQPLSLTLSIHAYRPLVSVDISKFFAVSQHSYVYVLGFKENHRLKVRPYFSSSAQRGLLILLACFGR